MGTFPSNQQGGLTLAQMWGHCLDLQWRVNLNDFTWLVYIIKSPNRNIEAWHDSITLQILPKINIRVQYIRYTTEYILKLQIHQHSFLNRKVFSRHNSLAQVFIIGSSLLDHHHWIIKAGSSSSSLLPLSRTNGAISQFYSSQEVLQSQSFFMLVVGLASM